MFSWGCWQLLLWEKTLQSSKKLQEITESPEYSPQCTYTLWGLDTHLHPEKHYGIDEGTVHSFGFRKDHP
jgi:hypothetical protein